MANPETDGATLQQRTLALYLQMAACPPKGRMDWTRSLVMLTASDGAAPLALAAVIAGAAVLWVCPDETALRTSSLSGLTDFQVTTLSEALRILKNEIRKGEPVCVGVLDAGESVWSEAVHRGVQPDAVLGDARESEALATMGARGAERLSAAGADAPLRAHVADTWRERRASDAALLASAEGMAEPKQLVAVRWLRSAPRLFPRDHSRFYPAAWSVHPITADAGSPAG